MSKSREARAILREMFESRPLSTFTGFVGEGPELFLTNVFGPDVSVAPIIHTADLGAWISHRSVILTLPGKGTFGFMLQRDNDNECRWDQWDRWTQMKVVSSSLSGRVWQAEDPLALATKMFRKVAKGADDDWRYDRDRHDAFNSENAVWMLHHLTTILPPDEAGYFPFLMALANGPDCDRVREAVESVSNISINWTDTRDAEQVVIDATIRFNGVTLNGRQVEKSAIPGALMAFPRARWDVEANRLIAKMYAAGDLDKDYYPRTPPTPPAPPTSPPRGKGPFAIAA